MSSRYSNLDLERSPVGMSFRCVDQWVEYDDMTDGGSTAATLDLTNTIPAGSFVLGSKVKVTTGFTGDTSCVLDIGTSSDTDQFSYTTHNIYTASDNLVEAADGGNAGTETGIVPITSATTIRLTATSAADWGSVSAGRMYVQVFYLSTNPEITENYSDRNKWTV